MRLNRDDKDKKFGIRQKRALVLRFSRCSQAGCRGLKERLDFERKNSDGYTDIGQH